jgi:hypothetical protein
MNNVPNDYEMNRGNPLYEEAKRNAAQALEIQGNNPLQEDLVNKLALVDTNLDVPQNSKAAASFLLQKELELILATLPANVRNNIHNYLTTTMIYECPNEENKLLDCLQKLKWWKLYEKLDESVADLVIEDPRLQSMGSYLLKAFKRFAMRYNGFQLPNTYTYTVENAYTIRADNNNGQGGGKRRRSTRKATRKQKKSRKHKRTRKS